MTELMKNAWLGWLDFTTGGKLAALFLAALVYLWLTGKWKEHRSLFFYALFTALCCILPVTAAVLMLYQTRFYNYVWLWSLVPMTAVTAWAAVEVISQLWEKLCAARWKRWFTAVALLLIVPVLSSGSVKNIFDPAGEQRERRQAQEVLTEMLDLREGEMCLWAPREILAYAREFDGSVRLLYGRNMWDAYLGAYTYDIYPDELRELYLWMENVNGSGLAEVEDEDLGKLVLKGSDCVATALDAGADHILLPGRLEPDVAEELAETVGVELKQVGEYYLLKSRCRRQK